MTGQAKTPWRTIHSSHCHCGWDNSLEPVATVAPGETITLQCRDAGDGHYTAHSTATDIATMDPARVNPVTGPVRRLQRPFLADYDAMLRGLAAGTGTALADLAPRWRAAFAADPALVPPDGLHPGDAATAAVTVPALAGMLAAAAGRTC